KELLKNSCNALPVRQREIITMRFFENMHYAEIAEIMGLANAKTVRTMLYRGLNRLAEELTPKKIFSLFSGRFAVVCLFTREADLLTTAMPFNPEKEEDFLLNEYFIQWAMHPNEESD